MGHDTTGRRHDARQDESPWDDVTKRKNDPWEDLTTRRTSAAAVTSLDFGETFVDSSLPFGLLGLALSPRETPPPATVKRPSAPGRPSLPGRSGLAQVIGAKAPATAKKPPSMPPPPPRKSTPPALPKLAAPPSSKPSSSRPSSRPSYPGSQAAPATMKDLTHTAQMASAPARTPSSVSIATPMAFAAPQSFIAPQTFVNPPSRMFDATPTRPRFIEMREPLPSISVEIESLPPLFTPPRGSDLAPISVQVESRPLSAPAPMPAPAPSRPFVSPLASFAAATADGSGSVPASVMALGDLSTNEVSLSFRSIKPQTAYIWAAAILILGIVSGTAFGSRLSPSAASGGQATTHFAGPVIAPAPLPAAPKVEAPPAQPPIEEIAQAAVKPAPEVKKPKATAPVAPTFVATVKPAAIPVPVAPVTMPAPAQVGPSRIAVLTPPSDKKKKGEKVEFDSAAAAATLADSQRETANAL